MISGITNDSWLLSSAVGDLVVTADSPVRCRLSQNEVILYNQTLSPYNGKITLSLRDIIEDRLDSELAPSLYFIFAAGSEAICFRVLRARRSFFLNTPAGWHERFFLTSAPYKFIPQWGRDVIGIYNPDSRAYPIYVSLALADADGNLKAFRHEEAAPAAVEGVSQFILSVSKYINMWKQSDGFSFDFSPVALTIACGEKMLTFYIRNKAPAMVFKFYNAFNIREYLWLYGINKSEFNADKSFARIGGADIPYDLTLSKSFETVGELSDPDYLRWMAQVAESPRVWAQPNPVSSTDPNEIIVEKFEADIFDAAIELESPKFTWHDASALPFCEFGEVKESRIFSDEHSKEFA